MLFNRLVGLFVHFLACCLIGSLVVSFLGSWCNNKSLCDVKVGSQTHSLKIGGLKKHHDQSRKKRHCGWVCVFQSLCFFLCLSRLSPYSPRVLEKFTWEKQYLGAVKTVVARCDARKTPLRSECWKKKRLDVGKVLGAGKTLLG